jgi:hypothetical protein
MDGQPLKPLTHGNILIVGAKASNFSEEIKSHPRVVIWDSQNESWIGKSLPHNVQAVFVTRWIGHNSFGTILAEARKRHITMFNPEGTGIIAKQVKELLDMNKPVETIRLSIQDEVRESLQTKKHGGGSAPKLTVLLQYVDWSKSNTENARVMMTKLAVHGITSTEASLANFIGIQRKKITGKGLKETHPRPKPIKTQSVKSDTGLDVAVQMLDDAIQQMKDMRAYLIATVEENNKLRARLDKFRKMIDE